MAQNGQLSASELASIPGGKLAIEAAAAWNARGGPADAKLEPGGPESSYRTLAGQEKQRAFWCGQGTCGNAAVPGTSNHGLGLCVDLKESWMRTWIDQHGAEFGWQKTEAASEWWHVNYVGGVDLPTFEPLKKGSRGKRVEQMTNGSLSSTSPAARPISTASTRNSRSPWRPRSRSSKKTRSWKWTG